LARLIAQATAYNGSFVFDDSRPDGAMQKLLDGRRFRRLTGWNPGIDLRTGIAETVRWYREHAEKELAHAY
jgi:nucleoside-diphosphate-sugar epimerase